MIVIVDYGVGNLRSILHKVIKLGIEAKISSKISDIGSAQKLILPGVGNFSRGMENMKSSGLKDVLEDLVLSRNIPILGICLGMQLFGKRSEEGNVEGLGWIDAETKRFDFQDQEAKLRIPHVGWNKIKVIRDCGLLDGIDVNNSFYFTHSYYVKNNDANDVVAVTDYGFKFTSIVQEGNIYGTQFHPEKSHFEGMKIIENFIKKC